MRAQVTLLVGCLLGFSDSVAVARADTDRFVGKLVVKVELVSDGRPIEDDAVADLVETKIGQPLSMRQVRESLVHLFSLGRYGGVQVDASELRGGVALLYELSPLQLIERLEFDGQLGLSAGDLRDAIARTHGDAFSIDAVRAAKNTLRQYYRGRGFLTPKFSTRLESEGARQVLQFNVESGQRATVDRVSVLGISSPAQYRLVLDRLGLRAGVPYDGNEIDRRLNDYEGELRRNRYYEARLTHDIEISRNAEGVIVLLDVQRGARVTVRFSGDAVPGADPADLVPVEREASVDEDLLEDADRRITEHLYSLGYRDASVTHRRSTTAGELSIVFTVTRGPRYQIASVDISGNMVVPSSEIMALGSLTLGDPLVMADLDAGLAAVVEHYNRLGFATVRAVPVVTEIAAGSVDGSIAVAYEIEIVEGEQTSIRSVVFDGSDAWDEESLGAAIDSVPREPYYGPQVNVDRNTILSLYLNEGYEQAVVTVETRFDDDLQAVDLIFRIREGPQVLVDHILVVGSQRVKSETIRRELAIEAGAPLGLDDVAETRRRLNALGMFRRLDILEFSHGEMDRRDVVIVVEDSPATRLAYGGGLEVSQRLRRETDEVSSQAVERIEFAPRGFFEIGRRNLFGKNRSIDLFTRFSVRRKNDPADLLRAATTSTFGFNEYRVLGVYREPRTFGLGWDVLVSGYVEQAIRPGFDLFSRGFTSQLTRQVTPTVSTTVGYRLGQNDTSNQELNPEDEDIVDRLFPNVRLSSFSANQVRDTRDDPFDPTRGMLLGIDSEVAARTIGSAVGFAKTYMEGFVYRAIPRTSRMVVAAGMRVGMAWGFPRFVEVAPDVPGGVERSQSVAVPLDDPVLPRSERFYAGGDTTVRGFALDRLGDPLTEDGGTIDQDGFPQGGNAMVLLNSELRINLTRDLGLVTFLDAGNVYDRVQNLSLRRIRSGAGFGIRYRSPVGPIRVDLGFKLGERQFFGSDEKTRQQEPLTAVHISIGQAF